MNLKDKKTKSEDGIIHNMYLDGIQVATISKGWSRLGGTQWDVSIPGKPAIGCGTLKAAKNELVHRLKMGKKIGPLSADDICSYRNKITRFRKYGFPKSAASMTEEFAKKVEEHGDKLWIAKTAFGMKSTIENLEDFLNK